MSLFLLAYLYPIRPYITTRRKFGLDTMPYVSTLVVMSRFTNSLPDVMTQAAANELRKTAFYEEISQAQLARSMRISRQAINRKLSTGNLNLREFIAIAQQMGKKPSEVLSRAEEQVQGGYR